jgi:hypothetical protein
MRLATMHLRLWQGQRLSPALVVIPGGPLRLCSPKLPVGGLPTHHFDIPRALHKGPVNLYPLSLPTKLTRRQANLT